MEQKCFRVYVYEYTILFMHFNFISDATAHGSLVANIFLIYKYLYKFHAHDENKHPSKYIQRYSMILSKILGNPMWMTLFIWYASELTLNFTIFCLQQFICSRNRRKVNHWKVMNRWEARWIILLNCFLCRLIQTLRNLFELGRFRWRFTRMWMSECDVMVTH